MDAVAGSVGKTADDLFQIEYRPFQLNPAAPMQGESRMEYLYARMGGKAAVERILPRMTQTAAECGLKFSYGKNGKTGNTLQSHRLMSYALEHATPSEGETNATLQDKLAVELFSIVFEKDGDITDNDQLVECCKRAGLDADACHAILSDGDVAPSVSDVTAEMQHYRRNWGVSGVPFIKFDSSPFSGAQDASFIAPKLLTALKKQNLV